MQSASLDRPANASRQPRRFITSILQAAVSLSLLAWIFWAPETRANVAALLREADPRWMAAAIAVAGLTIFTSITRWHCVLGALKIRPSWIRTSAIWLSGYFFDLFILGATGGDVMKALLLMREEPKRKVTAALSIIIDHLAGIFALAVAATAFTLFRREELLARPATAAIFWFLAGYLVLCLGALLLVVMIGFLPPPACIRQWPFFRDHGDEVHRTFRTMLAGWRQMVAAVALSFVVWTGHFCVFYCSARAVGAAVNGRDLLAAIPISEALVTLPISVAGLGVREQGFQLLLGTLGGVPFETAVLISLGGFTACLVWNLIGGVIFAFYRSRRLH